ncbi:mechanosensitive ion channel domain-containing protein [uncultured Algimonas sp.]|uniref:mechanosensitive ion channel domain-containing protein n=1 Tax=uncultured Algimonas sp. TaxID=1547920 RepID=UPI002616195D|nr:mechanosensitive ion channel domain-containing protein [uncultured Algimonas sp.]
MNGSMHIRAGLTATGLALIWTMLSLFTLIPVAATAQDAPAATTAPDFTTQSLRAQIEALDAADPEGDDALTAEQTEQLRTSLTAALERLEGAAEQSEIAAQFNSDVETGRATLAALRDEIDVLQQELRERPALSTDAALVGEAAMFATEQSLLAKESQLRVLQAELEGYRTQTSDIGARLTAAPRELNQARTQLGEVSAALTALGTGELDRIGQARRKALRAREYFLRRQIAALEAEIASLPVRQEIVTARRNLAELRAEALTEEILALQDMTGQRKVVEATQQAQRMRDFVASLDETHPLIEQMARENLRLADVLTNMARDESVTSRRLAAVRGATANVQNDLTAATELVSLGQLDREAGATLRRLGNQLTPAPQLRADLRDTQRALSQLTRQRVVAQEQLRDMPVGAVDPESLLQAARRANPALGALSRGEASAIRQLAEQRRAFLRQISANATGRINAVAELQTAQNELAKRAQELRTVLDENLLWVPSVPAIGLDWPGKVVRGATELFSPTQLRTAAVVLLDEARRLWPVVLFFGLAVALAYRLRVPLWQDIKHRADDVGRVKQDSLWHTPAVIGACLVMALPWPLIFGLLSILFGASDNPDLLVDGLSDGFGYLSLFSLIIVSWRYFDRDRSVFGAHFKLHKSLRHSVQDNLRWFLPVVGTTSFLLAVMSNMRGDNIYEGFSLAVFIVTASALAAFFFMVLWRTRDSYASAVSDNNVLTRYRVPMAVFAIGLPVFAALMAGAGWYDSADDILVRLFASLWVLLLSYVLYGAVRRAITVSQRQIKYRQAVERREAQIKARQEQQDAEARGEDMPAPPPVDTDAIDVSAMSRQSAQLLKTLVVIGLAAMLWFIWSGLLPALTIFDGFQLGEIGTGDVNSDTGEEITRSITLWTVLQAVVIAVLTIIAARNLPGFLEIFILNRMGVDAGARYAVVTILGYIIIATGIVFAFQRIGLQWGQLQWVVGGLSLGIGIGLQKIFANFVSGLIILFERPIRIGDFVTIGDNSGTVTRIKIRATTLGDLDNREILIPNENLISQEVTNWTLSNSVTRVIVYVGVAYGSDTDRSREIMMDIVKSNNKILETPPPQVFFLGFGDSSLDFEVRVFLRNFEDRFPVRHTLHTEINKALAEAGIEIPFPQRDLHIRSQDMPLGIESKTVAPARPGQGSSLDAQIEAEAKKSPAKKTPAKKPPAEKPSAKTKS